MKETTFVMGGSSAIAQQLVAMCLQQGQSVVVGGRDPSDLAALYGNSDSVRCVAVQATDPVSVDAAFEQLAQEGHHVHRYAHCVGSILVAPLVRTTNAQIDSVLSTNLLSAMYGLRAFLKHRKQLGGGGAAVLVSTCATGIGVANHEAIAAAKGGLEGLARSAAATHAPDGIRVNVVAPGLTDTPMAKAFLSSELMRAASARQYPLEGINSPAEVAQAMAWLLGEESSRITGQVLSVDGGFRAIRPLVK